MTGFAFSICQNDGCDAEVHFPSIANGELLSPKGYELSIMEE